MPIKAALPCPVVSPNNCLPAVMPKSLCLKCHALLGKGLQSQLFQAFGDKTLPTASARDVTPRPRNLNLPQHPDGQSNCKDIRKVHMATQHTKQSAWWHVLQMGFAQQYHEGKASKPSWLDLSDWRRIHWTVPLAPSWTVMWNTDPSSTSCYSKKRIIQLNKGSQHEHWATPLFFQSPSVGDDHEGNPAHVTPT